MNKYKYKHIISSPIQFSDGSICTITRKFIDFQFQIGAIKYRNDRTFEIALENGSYSIEDLENIIKFCKELDP